MTTSNYISPSAVVPAWQQEMILRQMGYLKSRVDTTSKKQLAELVALRESLVSIEEPLLEGWRV